MPSGGQEETRGRRKGCCGGKEAVLGWRRQSEVWQAGATEAACSRRRARRPLLRLRVRPTGRPEPTAENPKRFRQTTLSNQERRAICFSKNRPPSASSQTSDLKCLRQKHFSILNQKRTSRPGGGLRTSLRRLSKGKFCAPGRNFWRWQRKPCDQTGICCPHWSMPADSKSTYRSPFSRDRFAGWTLSPDIGVCRRRFS